jgi:C-terminal processing protease CtpA/Prc
MNRSLFSRVIGHSLLVAAFFALAGTGHSQGMDRIEKGRMRDILKIVKNEVKNDYYDPAFHGIDLDARFKLAEDKLDQAATTSQSIAIIAQVLVDFNDSHLFLLPPPTNLAVEYGWRMQAIGDKVYVTQVKPGSDAETKGLKRGDQIVSIGGFRPSKKELWKVLYYYNTISKRDKVILSVLSPGEETPRDLEIKSKIERLPQKITFQTYFRIDDSYDEENDKHRFQSNADITIWKMPTFVFDPAQVNGLVDRAKQSRGLILDLRHNGGGYVVTMEALAGNFFDTKLKIAEVKGRKKTEPSFAKTRGANGFTGKLIVLVDSESGSASEIFARLIQLEKRGTVLGDVSAGAVMQSIQSPQQIGTDSIVPFAISITNADVIMSDGKSLEHVGVIPDEIIVPTGADLAAGRDPVLARAVELLGGKLTAEDAGKLFKYYWKK